MLKYAKSYRSLTFPHVLSATAVNWPTAMKRIVSAIFFQHVEVVSGRRVLSTVHKKKFSRKIGNLQAGEVNGFCNEILGSV